MRLLAALLLLGLSSCFISRTTTNVPLQRSRLDELRPGTTTAKEVVELLGAPNEVVQLGSRFTIIIVSFLNEDARTDRAWLFFNKDEILTHVGGTFEGNQAQYAMPWQDIHGVEGHGQ